MPETKTPESHSQIYRDCHSIGTKTPPFTFTPAHSAAPAPKSLSRSITSPTPDKSKTANISTQPKKSTTSEKSTTSTTKLITHESDDAGSEGKCGFFCGVKKHLKKAKDVISKTVRKLPLVETVASAVKGFIHNLKSKKGAGNEEPKE